METEIKKREKQSLRKEMSRRRNQLTVKDIQSFSGRLFERLCGHDIYRRASVVYSYGSFRSEVDTWKFNRRVLSDGKILALPKVISKERMEFYRTDSMNQLSEGYMGILEPGPECVPVSGKLPECGVGIILVPGLAFDENFFRLGYGGGYYDRYLSRLCRRQSGQGRWFSCGAAFDSQMVKQIPREVTDYPLDYIVTETRILERMDEK